MFEMKLDIPNEPFVVHTTDNRGQSPEEVAELCVNRLISIGDDAHPVIQAQARAYRDNMLAVVAHYIKVGIDQNRATICAELRKAGQHELADQLRRL